MSAIPPQEPTATPPQKKGMGVWGWLAIGCGVVAVLAVGTCVGVGLFVRKKAADFEKNPAKAAAEMVVRLNQDVELVSSTDEEITVRNKKTGEVVTVDFEDAKNGRFTFKTKEGEATIDADADPSGEGGTLKVTGTAGETAAFTAGTGAGKVPEWVPLFADATVSGNYDAKTAEGHAGAVTITTSASVAEVMKFYKEKFEASGFVVETLTVDRSSGGDGGTVIGTAANRKRNVNVVVSVADGKTQALVTFSEVK